MYWFFDSHLKAALTFFSQLLNRFRMALFSGRNLIHGINPSKTYWAKQSIMFWFVHLIILRHPPWASSSALLLGRVRLTVLHQLFNLDNISKPPFICVIMVSCFEYLFVNESINISLTNAVTVGPVNTSVQLVLHPGIHLRSCNEASCSEASLLWKGLEHLRLCDRHHLNNWWVLTIHKQWWPG